MRDFAVDVVFDSPVLLGGPPHVLRGGRNKPVDSTLRPPSVRGLMHTFARALMGPLLGSDSTETRRAERLLLGAQGGVRLPSGLRGRNPDRWEFAATFRLEVVPRSIDPAHTPFPNCPHDWTKGDHEGFAENSRATLVVRPRPGAVATDPDLPAMLWVVLWTALSFGSIGNRCRRGYGSLRITRATPLVGAEATIDLGQLDPDLKGTLPVWPTTPSDECSLATGLSCGLDIARRAAHAWLVRRGPGRPGGSPLPPPAATTCNFFQILGPDWVYVGSSASSSTLAMQTLMTQCKTAKGSPGSSAHTLYSTTVGAAGRSRLASPLWVRLYRVGANGKVLPMATFAPVDSNRTLVDQILKGIGATDATGAWRTIASLNRGCP